MGGNGDGLLSSAVRRVYGESEKFQDSDVTAADHESDVSTVLLCSVNSLGLWQL